MKPTGFRIGTAGAENKARRKLSHWSFRSNVENLEETSEQLGISWAVLTVSKTPRTSG